ncbi:hypothetical protein DRE_04611 [Drechslerella stenobrocha 248]|uniref:Uncharacterized protein n=1 Tax=Drechslerella stenobrocha 248 TaxID=1043628 RepID=W7I1W1_9PEZI|nr:hypothetical protein DRE_04611 [Drechslerella stenobrocha 248]
MLRISRRLSPLRRLLVPHRLLLTYAPAPVCSPAYTYTYTYRYTPSRHAHATGKRPADEAVDRLSELYASAKDEFEIAVEETAKNSIYARDDRETAREELQKLQTAYDEAVANSPPADSEEIKRRVGQRLRELDSAVQTLSQADTEH